MRFAVLGPLEVRSTAGVIPLSSPKQRQVLASLIAAGGRAVGADRQIDELWRNAPPAGARKALAWHILQLRNSLGDKDFIVWDGEGYLLSGSDYEVDAERFAQLHREGVAVVDTDPEAASRLLNEALNLWRGDAYEGLAEFGSLRAEANRLEELRIVALEQRFRADLALGRHGELIPELTTLVADVPYRETLRGHLMLALYRSGRQSDALRVFREGHKLMSEELGLEPGSGLRDLEHRILNADPSLDPPRTGTPWLVESVATVTPAQLPADIATFTARGPELESLLRQADTIGDSQVPAVACISGMAGSGKTTLALHAAHRLAERFPDGQLYLDLHGFGGDSPPVAVGDALDRLLRGIGVPGEEVPVAVDEKAVLWRSKVRGRRLLIVLDDASSDEQVRALLPGGSGHVVLVTSRRRLLITDDTRLVRLGELSSGEAEALFIRITGVDGDDEAIRAGLRRVVALCGFLPLAVQLVASRMRHHPHWTLDSLGSRLSDQHRLLGELRVGDRSVAAAFHFSYRQLSPEHQRVFRLIGLAGGPDFDIPAAAALAGFGEPETETILEYLADAHLLEARPGDRYQQHDLVRLFARQRCDAEDDETTRTEARQRMRSWYVANARAAARVLRPHREVLSGYAAADAVPSFGDAVAATRWFDREQHNLYALLAEAEAQSDDTLAWALADAMRGYFFIRGDHDKWVSISRAGLGAAQRQSNPAAEGAMRYAFGQASTLYGDYEPAIAHYREALRLIRKAGSSRRAVEILLSLAAAQLQQSRPRQAAEYCHEALELPRGDIGPLYSDVLHLLGASHWQRGELSLAVPRLREAVESNRHDALGTLYDTYGTLALACADLGELLEAEGHAAQALRLSRERGIRHGAASAWSNLSSIYAEMGDPARAADCATRELDLAERYAMRTHKAYGLAALAIARLPDDPGEARRLALDALRLERHLNTNVVELDARRCLAEAHAALGEPALGIEHAEAGLRLARECDWRVGEGRALTVLAELHAQAGRDDPALSLARQAIALQRETGHRRGEARSRLAAAQVTDRTGDTTAAREHRRRAEDLYTQTGGRQVQPKITVS